MIGYREVGMYMEACEILMIGDHACAIFVDMCQRFREKWGRSPYDVVMEACALAQRELGDGGRGSKEE